MRVFLDTLSVKALKLKEKEGLTYDNAYSVSLSGGLDMQNNTLINYLQGEEEEALFAKSKILYEIELAAKSPFYEKPIMIWNIQIWRTKFQTYLVKVEKHQNFKNTTTKEIRQYHTIKKAWTRKRGLYRTLKKNSYKVEITYEWTTDNFDFESLRYQHMAI